eukprot:5503772-Pleurochrysis_carterae.AAC.1
MRRLLKRYDHDLRISECSVGFGKGAIQMCTLFEPDHWLVSGPRRLRLECVPLSERAVKCGAEV